MKKNNQDKVWSAIYRQWIWADHLRNYFNAVLPEKELNLNKDFTIEPYWMFMCLWYGTLFSVLEALRNIKVEIPEAQENINLLYPVLRRYRNAVFHIQKNYWPDKWESLILDHISAKKIQKMHKQVGLFLLKQLQSGYAK